MTAPLFAACAALAFSLSSVFVRLGSRSVLPLIGVVLTLLSSLTVLTVALVIRGPAQPDLMAVVLFAAGGLLGPGLGRFISITSITKIGATRAQPINSAAQPLVAVMLGVFVLSETLALTRVAGIAMTLAGVLIVIRSGQRTAARAANEPALDRRENPIIVTTPRVFMWPVAAGTAFAAADLFRKSGIDRLDDTVLGAVIGMSVAVTIWGTVLLIRGQGPALLGGIRSHDSRWFLASGAASGTAQVLVLSALRDGELSLVGPILAIQPILLALLARIFIQRLEAVGLAVATAAVLAVVGTVLISL